MKNLLKGLQARSSTVLNSKWGRTFQRIERALKDICMLYYGSYVDLNTRSIYFLISDLDQI